MGMHRILLPGTLAMICATCGQSPPADQARRAAIPTPETARDAPADENPGGAKTDPIHYACDDGSTLRVTYIADQAQVGLPGGRVVALPKAQSASKGGGAVFVGEALSLQRSADRIQLYQDEGKSIVCRPSPMAE